MITVGLLVALFFLMLFQHPFLTYPLSLLIVRRFRRETVPASATDSISFSILFCGYNESAVLGPKLDNLLKIQSDMGKDRVQLLAFSDGSNDGTDAILRSRLQDPQSQLAICSDERRGKSYGMNQLVTAATNQIVVFTDANVLLDPNTLNAFEVAFSDPQVGVACGHLVYINEENATAAVGTKYWQIEESIKQLETDTGSAMGADGSLFAIRRELYATVPNDIIDDFYTSMRILCEGHRVIRVEGALAYERSTDKIVDENRRKVRIACRAMNCHRELAMARGRLSWLNRYKYFSHKWLRWHTGFWLLGVWAGLLTAFFGWGLAMGLAFCLLTVLVVVLAWLSFAFHVPVFSKAWVAFAGIYFTALGTIHSRMGKRYQTWTPVSSSRQVSSA